ncbi:MAG TPA: GNAT family N-acetyltransferase [Rhizomicrobium sp.]|nr:GNAT family N-acetyltransferase [Rhizomicrobium sp.]
MPDVVDNARLSRFELTEEGQTAFATYRRHDGRVTIPHVEAPVPLRGKGTAARLMEGIAALARARGVRIVPTCPYAIAWFRRHPEARDVLDAG